MKRTAATFFLLAAMTGATSAQPACNLKHPQACTDTNRLIWAPDTVPAIRAFLKGLPGNYLYPASYRKSSAASDAIALLGGPPDEPKRLANGLTLFSACRAHSCNEKGALIVDSQGKIRALGLVNYRCASSCLAEPVLTLFLKRGAGRAMFVDALENWARNAGANISSVEIIDR